MSFVEVVILVVRVLLIILAGVFAFLAVKYGIRYVRSTRARHTSEPKEHYGARSALYSLLFTIFITIVTIDIEHQINIIREIIVPGPTQTLSPSNTPIAPTTIPPTSTSVPTPVPPPPPTPTPIPTPYITSSIKPGDKLKVVNCEKEISLRTKPDAEYPGGRKVIGLNTIVTFVDTAENGFYIVKYENKYWYALAAYLAPIESEVFKRYTSGPITDKEFNQNDLELDGIVIGESEMHDIRNKYGDPSIIDEATNTWSYREQSFTFGNSKVVGVDIYGLNTSGPRGIKVGMSLAEALNTFKMDVSILENSRTHDLILYSSEKKKIDWRARYAVIHNDSYGGNGIVEFYDDMKNSHMKITIKNGFVRRISVYID